MKTDSQQSETVDEAKSEATLAAPSCSACVQVLRHGDTEPQWASKLVWWLASLASVPPREYREPKVGDIVIETTHRIGMARHGLGLIAAVGELVSIEKDETQGTIYTIKTLEGKEQRWSNAHMSVVDRPTTKLSDSPRKRALSALNMKNPKATENGKRVASSLERAGCASGSHDLTILRYKERQLSMCDQMLTDAGVPEWVMLSDSNGVPANSVPSRLKWYLARRKDVAAGEIDQGLQDDMKEMLRLARQRHNDQALRPRTPGLPSEPGVTE